MKENILTEEYCKKHKTKYLILMIVVYVMLVAMILGSLLAVLSKKSYLVIIVAIVGLVLCTIGFVINYRKQNMIENEKLMQTLNEIKEKIDNNS
jgi:predicted membrane channel-forming protein YqfA (hemolysin III family)